MSHLGHKRSKICGWLHLKTKCTVFKQESIHSHIRSIYIEACIARYDRYEHYYCCTMSYLDCPLQKTKEHNILQSMIANTTSIQQFRMNMSIRDNVPVINVPLFCGVTPGLPQTNNTCPYWPPMLRPHNTCHQVCIASSSSKHCKRPTENNNQ